MDHSFHIFRPLYRKDMKILHHLYRRALHRRRPEQQILYLVHKTHLRGFTTIVKSAKSK